MRRYLGGLAALCLAGGAAAQDPPPIPVLGVAVAAPDADALPREGRIARQAENALIDRLVLLGYPVAPVADALEAAGVGRLVAPHAISVAVARMPEPAQPDVLAVLVLYAKTVPRAFETWGSLRLEVELSDIATGELVSGLLATTPSPGLEMPAACGRECELAHLGEEAAALAVELAERIGTEALYR